MAHGLTLTAASTVIWFGPVWSAEIYMQACARVSRIGQKRTCQIIRLYGSPVEHRAYNLIDKRLSFQDNVLELVQTVAGASVNELDG
jgi:SNF2 family DNA or RNA helicase